MAGGVDGGGGVMGGGRGGGSSGGGAGGGGMGDAGVGVDAGLGPFQFGQVAVIGTTSTTPFVGLSGGSNDVWGLQESGHLLRSTGGPFSVLFKFGGGGRDVVVSGSTVVVALYRALRVCSGACTTEAAFSQFDLVSRGLDAWAVCSRGAETYAVLSNTMNGGELYRLDTGQWLSAGSLPLRYPRGCWFDDAGVLWIAGEGGVVGYDGQDARFEAVTPQVFFSGGAVLGGEPWVVGQGQRLARRGTGGRWSVTQVPEWGDNTLWAVGGGAEVAFALGSVLRSTTVRFLERTAGGWSARRDGLPGFDGQATGRVVRPLSDRERYIAGGNDSGPWVVRGTR